MRIASLSVLLVLTSVTVAQARCADDMKDVRLQVERAQRSNPTPQSAAAANELKRYSDQSGTADEVDCYNTIARVERILKASPVVGDVRPGEPASTVNEPVRSLEEQAK
jgi:hypothetical protein